VAAVGLTFLFFFYKKESIPGIPVSGSSMELVSGPSRRLE